MQASTVQDNVLSHTLAPVEGFVLVTSIHPHIQLSPRYALSENFMGYPFVGYNDPILFLTKEAAQALHHVQEEVSKEGFNLAIYDAYRPQRTVDSFSKWALDLDDDEMKDFYYPRMDKKDLFEKGFIAKKSSHSRGSTVDLTLIHKSKEITLPPQKVTRTLKDGFAFTFLDDGTVDMGSHFDLFDEASFHNSPLVEDAAQKNRVYLRQVMMRHGFKDYEKEWWHYTLINDPYPTTYFDFPVQFTTDR